MYNSRGETHEKDFSRPKLGKNGPESGFSYFLKFGSLVFLSIA